MNIKKDDEAVFKDKGLIRRRFYLSPKALSVIDALAIQNDKSPSLILEEILISVSKEVNQ